MKDKLTKLDWKGRLIFGFVSGIIYMSVLYLLNLILGKNAHNFNYYIIQEIAFGLFTGIGFPYVSEKFKKMFNPKIIKKELIN